MQIRMPDRSAPAALREHLVDHLGEAGPVAVDVGVAFAAGEQLRVREGVAQHEDVVGLALGLDRHEPEGGRVDAQRVFSRARDVPYQLTVDAGRETRDRYRGSGLPQAVHVDREGLVARVMVHTTPEEVARAIDELLGPAAEASTDPTATSGRVIRRSARRRDRSCIRVVRSSGPTEIAP